MAQASVFPDCCGIIILNKFLGGHPGASPESCISKTDLRAFLVKQEQEYFNKRAGLMAVLSEPQERQIGEIFRERKYDLIFEKNNPRTGQRIFMYFRDLNFTEARKRRIFGAER